MSLLKLSSLASYTASKLIEGVSIKIDEQSVLIRRCCTESIPPTLTDHIMRHILRPSRKTKAEVQYLTVVPFFDVKETFVLDGMTRTKNKRRDLESGPSTCTATLVNDSADVESENYVLKLKLSWDEPNKGGMLEEMHVSTAGELVVTSTVQVREGSATCRTVYEKVESQLVTKFQWNPLDAVRVMASGRLPTDRR